MHWTLCYFKLTKKKKVKTVFDTGSKCSWKPLVDWMNSCTNLFNYSSTIAEELFGSMLSSG